MAYDGGVGGEGLHEGLPVQSVAATDPVRYGRTGGVHVQMPGDVVAAVVEEKMITAVWKWNLAVTDVQKLDIPVRAKLLCVQIQNGTPRLWALVNPDAPTETRNIITLGTGLRVDCLPGKYVGTYQLKGGVLVFHVFDGWS